MGFDTNNQFILAIVISIIGGFLLCVASYKIIHMFQLGGYKARNLKNWYFDRRTGFSTRLFALSAISFGAVVTISIMFYNFSEHVALSYLGLIVYLGLLLMFAYGITKHEAKIALKVTSRVKRLYVVLFLVSVVASFSTLWLGDVVIGSWVRFSLVTLWPVFLPALVLLSNVILFPIEWNVRMHYIRKAKKKLFSAEYSNVIRVGITGSAGKTSCKNILSDMLGQRYKVAKSPSSFNTPMGFAKTMNDLLESQHEVIVFEMGLRHRGDIRQLAKLFRPQHGILSNIGNQHIETMKTIENIKNEKAELIRAIPKDGIAILNGDNSYCREVFAERDGTKFMAGICSKAGEGEDNIVHAVNIVTSSNGTTFDLEINDGLVPQTKRVTTILLGIHNVMNIVLSAAMAYKLGVTIEQIATAIENLEPTPHRLQLVKSDNGVAILDDSYNASSEGVAFALDVLSHFDGGRVVQTPGLIEQGKNAHEANFKYGMQIARVATKVIIVNKVNRGAITAGLEAANYDMDNVITVDTQAEAKDLYTTLLQSGDALLIANDLPDNFV